jgi:hypothetical protein
MPDTPQNDYIHDAIMSAGLRLSVEEKGDDLYDCRISGPDHTMVRDIQMKPGFEAPKLGGLVYHYAQRAQQSQSFDDILEWADETGEDLQAPGTIEKYKQLVEDTQAFRLLLGESVFNDLMAALAIDQAISNACGTSSRK